MAAPKKTPDRHYNFRGMNAVFAWSSIALLATTLWMVWDDYAKPWKRFQAEFRERERQQLVVEAEAERAKLNENEIAQIQQDIAAEEASLEGKRSEIEELAATLIKTGKNLYAADVRSRTTKSLLDTERFEYDSALQSGNEGRIAKRRAKVESLNARLTEERKELEAFTEQKKSLEAEIESKRSGVEEAEQRLTALHSGYDNLQQQVASLDKRIDYFVLNAPFMDFVLPDLKIEQVILSGLYNDINFTDVDRVDRCMTCHVAATRVGFEGEEWEEPFRSHPRPEIFLSASSPHPYNEFGCTTCHGGLDRATDFARAGHSPIDDEQEKEWIEKWGWKKQKYLESPIFPAKYSEAGCIGCHQGNLWTPGSELQDTGRQLINKMGCYVCHKIDYEAYEDLPRPGPSLRKVASKISPGFAYKWISAPRDFRPTSWMPHFFFQPNTTSEDNLERQRAEIRSIVAYLWGESETAEYLPAPPGNATRGQELFETVGCTGCHVRDAEAKRDDFFPQINRLHGPNLIRAGSKLSSGWLYAWIKDPKQYNLDTRMPSMRLTDQEAADITAYLLSSREPAFENLSLPEVDSDIRDELVLIYLQNNLTIEASHAALDKMDDGERDSYLGEETIQKYGCWGCHDVEGFENAKPIGVELTEEGSKPIHQFDFGHVHDVPHTRHDWLKTKMLEPRIWDEGKEAVKTYQELYRMPDFGMSEREAEAVVANVLGFTKDYVITSRRADQSPGAAALAAGRKLITSYNCQGCHLIEGQGHAIKSAIEDVGQLPPNLASQGARVQGEWLFGYLHDPSKVSMRPWLGVRMPTFGFEDEEVNTVVSYFQTRDERDAFLSTPTVADARSRAVGRVTFSMLQCAKCHPAGPQAGTAGVSAAELAPSLLLAPGRLRHDWVPEWIKDPQSWVRGTNMPANFQKMKDGSYQSPLAQALAAPMFASQKREMMHHFESEEELKAFLSDPDQVVVALRDHIWWNLSPN
ncbi:MAG: c-type cytochrome [bacterium]|nr:c-type cytochrome [bacterium]